MKQIRCSSAPSPHNEQPTVRPQIQTGRMVLVSWPAGRANGQWWNIQRPLERRRCKPSLSRRLRQERTYMQMRGYNQSWRVNLFSRTFTSNVITAEEGGGRLNPVLLPRDEKQNSPFTVTAKSVCFKKQEFHKGSSWNAQNETGGTVWNTFWEEPKVSHFQIDISVWHIQHY